MALYNPGDQIPDLKVTDAEGHLKPLSAQMGKRGLLIFALRGTWCAFCVQQIKSVQRHYHRYAGVGVTSVFITPESEDSLWTLKISQPQPLNFGLHSDPGRETMELFIEREHIDTLPATYLLDTDRRVVWRYIGKDAEDHPGHQTLLEAIAGSLVAT